MEAQTTALKELLNLSYPNQFRWLTEQTPTDPRISWVVTSLGEVAEDDLLLIEGREFSGKLAVEALGRGGAAILVLAESSLRQVVDPEGIPVASLQVREPLREIHRTLLNILVNQRAYLMERGLRIHAQLTKVAAEGEGLAGLVQTMVELSGRGILVQDKRLGVLGDYAPPSLVPVWDDVLVQLGNKITLPNAFSDRKEAGKATRILKQALADGLERIITPIAVGGVARGYLSLVDIQGRLDTLDRLIAEQGALVCGIEMARAKAVREAEKRLKGDLLTALLQEDITPRDANLWVRRMGLDLDHAHVAIRFAWDAPSPPSLRRLETLVNGEVARQAQVVLVDALGSEILCICQVESPSSRPEKALSLAKGVAGMAAQEFPQIPMRVGVGMPAGEITFWRDSFRQAGQALEMARRLRSREPRYYPDLSVYRLLLQLENHPDLHTFKGEILGPLLSYEGGGDFIQTLEAYFEHNGNLSQAAESLFIHRNTLTYRMERISEVTGLDLNHPETRLALQLALRIHRMLTSSD